MASNGSCFMVTRTIFKKPPLGRRPNTKLGDHGHSKRSQPLVYSILSCVRTCIYKNSLKQHLVGGPITYDFTLHLRVCGHTKWFWKCIGTAFGHFLLDSHSFMVTALGSCVKWPALSTFKTNWFKIWAKCHVSHLDWSRLGNLYKIPNVILEIYQVTTKVWTLFITYSLLICCTILSCAFLWILTENDFFEAYDMNSFLYLKIWFW